MKKSDRLLAAMMILTVRIYQLDKVPIIFLAYIL